MNQPFGDRNTVFVIHGSGFTPGTRVSVAQTGNGVSPIMPIVDSMGTFNYALDQGYNFFAGPIPVGVYQVMVTGSDGRHARATFQVMSAPRS